MNIWTFNNPLIKPYFLGGGILGVPLDSHDCLRLGKCHPVGRINFQTILFKSCMEKWKHQGYGYGVSALNLENTETSILSVPKHEQNNTGLQMGSHAWLNWDF